MEELVTGGFRAVHHLIMILHEDQRGPDQNGTFLWDQARPPWTGIGRPGRIAAR
jgi:hypothetical protein